MLAGLCAAGVAAALAEREQRIETLAAELNDCAL
jgi:hypothetical protein